MEQTGIQPDTDLDGEVALLCQDRSVVSSVAAVAARIDELCNELDALSVQLGVLVRDGGEDVRPSWSARDAMLAAGRLTAAADVIGSVAFAQTQVTGSHIDDGFRDARTWAHRHTGASAADTARWRRVSRSLERYPALALAFFDGRLRAHHLMAVDSIVPSRFASAEREAAVVLLCDIQAELIEVAAQSTQREFERFCARIRERLVDEDGPEPADGGGRSELHLRELPNGRWSLFGDLTADDGAIWATVLAQRLAAERSKHRDENQPNLFDSSDTADGDPDGSGTGSDDAAKPERPDHSVRMAAAARSLLLDGAGAKRPGQVGLYLHLDLDDFAVMGADVTAHTEANLDISDDTLWGLLAGAEVTPILADTGTPLTFGRTRRLAPPILRRVLAYRDATCWFPGCDRPPVWHHAHHGPHWDDGGTTDPQTCIGGCSEHHHQHHDDGWGVDPPGDGGPGGVTITRPDGTPLDPTPRWVTRRRERDPLRRRVLERLAADAA